MKLMSFTLVLSLAVVASVLLAQRAATPAAPQSPFTSVVDLTHPTSDKTPGYELDEKFEARTTQTYDKEGYFARSFSMPEHFGTHLDAPAHFARGRWTVDQIPPERLVAPLVVLDVSAKADRDPDYLVSAEDIAFWEHVNGKVPAGAVVIARTGWSSRWNTPEKYRNADAKGVMHFPGWSPEAVRLLVDGRNIYGLGIDTLSVDPGTSKDFPVHRFTSARSVYHLENVANLSRAPEAGGVLIAAPLDLQGGSGAPARVFAVLR